MYAVDSKLLTSCKLCLGSPGKLKRTTEWMGRLRRTVEVFNRCLDACGTVESNEARLVMVEVFGIFTI
jgi:hypothetical protein